MERFRPQSIGDILRNVLQESSLQDRLDYVRAAESWPHIVGTEIASKCEKPTVKDGIMKIGVANASLRHELSMNKTELIRYINETVGKPAIKDIRFVS